MDDRKWAGEPVSNDTRTRETGQQRAAAPPARTNGEGRSPFRSRSYGGYDRGDRGERGDRGDRYDRADRGDRDSRRPGDRRLRRPRRRVCSFCVEKVTHIDYKEHGRLRDFVSDRGKILKSRSTGTCARHQRALGRAIKRARQVALLPFVVE